MQYLIVLLLLLNSIVCHADVYQHNDNQGNTIYSDTPLNHNAQRINNPATLQSQSASSPQTNTAVTSQQANSSLTTVESIKQPYKVFFIASPKDQETIQNQPVIPVKITIDPPLQAGDKIQLFLDGNRWNDPVESTDLEMAEVDRGTHKLSAMLIDNDNTVVKQSGPITIYVHHASVNSIKRNQ